MRGISLTELAQKIEAAKSQKRDLVCDTRELSLTSDGKTLAINGQDDLKVTDICHRQIGDRLNIPAKYYQRMQAEEPELLATNVNTWFKDKPERRMVRGLGDTARAFLSDKFNRIEHEHIAEQVLPVLAEHDGLEVVSCELTERRLYLKAVNRRVEGEVAQGDAVQAGVIISNSEIGMGAVQVSPFVLRLVCTNGLVMPDNQLKAHHVGARITSTEAVHFAEDTIRADDNSLLLRIRDVTRASMSQALLDKSIEKFQEAAGQKIEGNPIKAIETLGKRSSLNDEEQGSVLRHLVEGGDLSRWGAVNAITRAAQDVESYDRMVELEQFGGKLLDLPAREWTQIAQAA